MKREETLFSLGDRSSKCPPGSQTACTQNQRKGQQDERYIPIPQWETRYRLPGVSGEGEGEAGGLGDRAGVGLLL